MLIWLKKFKRIFRKKGVDENVSGPEPHTEELLSETESSQEKQNYKEIKECFDICSLVNFAKYEANEEDFNKIIKTAEKIIKP